VAAVPEQCSSAAARFIQPGSGGPRITRKVRAGACHWLGELASSLSDLFRKGWVSGFLRLVGSCLLSSIPDRLGWAAAELEACFATDADWKVSDFLTAGEVES
jgi:hypothetical protein